MLAKKQTMSNMVECKDRGEYLMGLTFNGNYALEDTANYTVYVPKKLGGFIWP